MIPDSPKWFPIHLHCLPAALAIAPPIGAVVCIEWRPRALAAAYGWQDPWPSAAGERLLSFVRQWKKLAARTPLARTDMIHFAVEGETDFGDPCILSELRDAGLISVDIFRALPNRYFDRLQGLTADGLKFLTQMKRLNLFLDLTHAPEEALAHILAQWSGRCVASHVVCADLLDWSLFRAPNAWTDEGLRLCRSDLFGVPFVDDIVSLRKTPLRNQRQASIETITRHILHLAHVVGPERVALGPDYFDYGLLDALGVEAGTVDGLESSQGLSALFAELMAAGMSVAEVEGVFWGNACRVLHDLPAVIEKEA